MFLAPSQLAPSQLAPSHLHLQTCESSEKWFVGYRLVAGTGVTDKKYCVDCANKKVCTIISFCVLYDQGEGTARPIPRYPGRLCIRPAAKGGLAARCHSASACGCVLCGNARVQRKKDPGN